VNLKQARLDILKTDPNFSFRMIDISDTEATDRLFKATLPKRVIHLAAQAGVRYSISNPSAYGTSNLVGFLNILEGCRKYSVSHLVFASTSSVYGANSSVPYSVRHAAAHPLTLYAATKRSNELMAHAYAHLFRIPITGLRFFTVYGPWGRPDMSYFLFANAIVANQPIQVFNNGTMSRDFTYIDDIVDGVMATLNDIPVGDPNWSSFAPDPSTSSAPYRLFNLGNSSPIELLSFIEHIENAFGREAKKVMVPMQPGDVLQTWADITESNIAVGYEPRVPVQVGIPRFVSWYKEYFGV